MNRLDQNKILTSLEFNLENHSRLIDSRTEKDDLSFLVDFASLINFYDKNNIINGNWAPFLLKDPVFLIASIAKTPFKKMHSLFIQTCLRLEEVLGCKKTEGIKTSKNEQSSTITNSINQLFNQLIRVFHLLEQWTHFMVESSLEYNLKTYVIKEIKEKYSQFLWALLWLKEKLHINKQIEGISSVNQYVYKSYNQVIWKQSNGKVPYWELLNLKHPLIENTDCDFYKSLKNTGEIVFSFFNSIIEYAPVEFENLKKQKDIFPDTLLLHTFTKLMKIYKDQLNGISKKHLGFYYKDILKQKKQEATPDSVFVCTDLSELTSTFELEKGTLFNGGQYIDKSPVLYKTINNVSLNPALITDTYTLSQGLETEFFSKLYLKKEKEVTTVQEDEDGKIKQWKTFGSQNSNDGKKVELGFAIASPMLFLREGSRVLRLCFTFSEKIADINFFNQGDYYLSTEEEWYQIPKTKKGLKIIKKGDYNIHFVINLEKTAPAIVSFLENPDGIKASWPMFKMSYSKFTDLAIPLNIASLTINVAVTELQTFQLYNDFGLLEVENPFQPLGPTPEKNQNFIIGSAEVFSKPVRKFSMQMNWNNLPENFYDYYYQYNNYLSGGYLSPELEKELSIINKIVFFFKHLFKEVKEEEPDVILEKEVFNDKAFTVDFQLLQNKLWLPINMNMLLGLQNLFFQNNEDKEFYSNCLFQGIPEVITFEKKELSEFICIKNQLKIESYLRLQDSLRVFIDLNLGNGLEIKDYLEIEGLFQIESRAEISDIIKIKNIDITYLFENESIIKFSDVFEINQYLKVKEFLLITSQLKIKNFLKIEDHLKNHQTISYKENSIQFDLNISDELQIDSQLKVCDLLTFDKDLLLKDAFEKNVGDLITVKKEIKVTDLFKWNQIQINTVKDVFFKGSISYENKLDESIKIAVSGTIRIANELQLTTILYTHYSSFFFEILENNTSKEEFIGTTYKKMFNESVFGSSEIFASQQNIDPSIQNNPLEYTESTSTGFIKMQLNNPKEGFGSLLYPKVVSAIAMYNAELLALIINKDKDYLLAEPANEPFIPIIGFFKGNYTSSCTYEYNSDTGTFESLEIDNYPVECFYYTAFKNYKVYDSSLTISKNEKINNGFPAILPKYEGKGQLFLGLEEVIAPAELSFYFELGQDYTTTKKEKNEITYEFLGEKGWQKLSVISDTTNGFSCSGFITFNVPAEITSIHYTMPNDKYWISISVNNNPDWYAQTTFLKTNGFKLQRTGVTFKTSPIKPQIKANIIESPYEAIPEIATVIQPFSSFGGRAAETERDMNKRVSIRLKTKDRVVTSQDYYRVITETFTEIYYAKIFYNRKSKNTEVYVVQKKESWKDSNAFLPVIDECLKQQVKSYLIKRASSFANIEVNNFNMTYVKVIGEIKIAKGYKRDGVLKDINEGITIYLSPWIKTLQAQIQIDTGVSVTQISEFIKSYKSIKSIEFLKLYLGKKNENTREITYCGPFQSIKPSDLKPSVLLVPALNNYFGPTPDTYSVPCLNNNTIKYLG
ncbi:hypothetical protein [Tenacibaculum halocynthiae]|uniref:hypothetical protein n=1 Tax=Tenacibaculum halocynthiae TaxID=1254437 RepID=UPI003D646E00